MLGIETGPDWGAWVGYIFGVLGTIGSAIAVAYAWVEKQKEKRKAKAKKEQAEVAVPYKTLFENVEEKLETALAGLKAAAEREIASLEREALCRQTVARQEERIFFLEEEIVRLGGKRREQHDE